MQDQSASPVPAPAPAPVATWRIVTAAILDFTTAFFVLGHAVALVSGGTTATGFQLNGLPATVLFVLIIAYFVIGNRTGGTLWKRLLGVPVRRSA
ncbi:hypothetical protein [Enterovirga rhinocerotis]|uniref:RDD family protein n=1 Tax=Enterovirga rhinocerotis TaxID=1339210 RepID=A0A4R7BYY5_9HYPH|nr:hypothetical protein [Enterovirga rhinocerotis]TDR89975.1 hypothetical protein EV668_2812 [Enterovirga rhinocerotis]